MYVEERVSLSFLPFDAFQTRCCCFVMDSGLRKTLPSNQGLFKDSLMGELLPDTISVALGQVMSFHWNCCRRNKTLSAWISVFFFLFSLNALISYLNSCTQVLLPFKRQKLTINANICLREYFNKMWLSVFWDVEILMLVVVTIHLLRLKMEIFCLLRL